MDENQINERAQEYIKLETNDIFRKQVEDLLEDSSKKDQLRECFYRELDFGTGGLRGEIGGGYNRMNPYTVKKATQGLANYISKNVPKEKQIAVISYDSRNYSDLFAKQAALVLGAKGIKTYLFSSLRPTPELSYAVRFKGACIGIMVTASHNPAEYNGYKVFWGDGGQITSPHDTGIIDEVRAVTDDILALDEADALANGMLEIVDKEIDESYFSMVKNLSINPDLFKSGGMKVVYTPLHGAGRMPVETVMSDMGIDIFTVPEQREPDGNFPTVAFPNPEIAPAMNLALKYGKKRNADIILGTDPDSDRLGIAVPEGNGEFRLVTGNQLGVLLADYIFSAMKKKGTLPANSAFINTIVTTNLQNDLATHYGAESFKVLTGFKYIGEKIKEFEETGGHQYIFGGEESYGFLIGTEVRDKDAVSAALLTVEMALWNIVEKKRSVLDHLNAIYEQFGYYEEALVAKYFKGESGLKIMGDLMSSLRDNPPSQFAGVEVKTFNDFKTSNALDIASGNNTKIDLPSSNVLQFVLTDKTIVTVRPSGTESKIKFYVSACLLDKTSSLDQKKEIVGKKIKAIEDEIARLIPE